MKIFNDCQTNKDSKRLHSTCFVFWSIDKLFITSHFTTAGLMFSILKQYSYSSGSSCFVYMQPLMQTSFGFDSCVILSLYSPLSSWLLSPALTVMMGQQFALPSPPIGPVQWYTLQIIHFAKKLVHKKISQKNDLTWQSQF